MGLIVGIDLGTSTSEIGYLKDGKPVLIPNHLGEVITPSVVHIKEDGSVIVGNEAREQLLLQPECTFMEVKRVMGSNKALRAHGKSYTPQQISAYIIEYLVGCARKYFEAEGNEEDSIEGAVITVPAYFTDIQRRMTIEAGNIAGIEVKRIVNEPTAAALDYGLSNIDKCQNILVYDLGGGTLDVTILELFEGVVDVKATCGNNELGGKEFDQVIIEDIKNKFKDVHKVDISSDVRAMMRLKKEAELCKIKLSEENEVTIELPFFMEVAKNPVSINETITREYFQELIKEKVASTAIQISQALKDAELKPSDLDIVLLVGGSTKIPYISQFLEEELGQDPQKLIDPDLGVALGAAVQAGIINDDLDEETNLIITDVCPHTLSTEVLSRESFIESLVCDPLIPRNTTIPVTRQKLYCTSCENQKQVEIKVYQGESLIPEENTFLNAFILSGIPRGGAGKQKITINFSYDSNGILEVTGTIVTTGKKLSIKINTNDVPKGTKIDVSQYKNTPLYRRYRSVITKAEKVLLKEGSLLLESLIQQLKECLVRDEDENAEDIKMEIIDLLFTLDRNSHG